MMMTTKLEGAHRRRVLLPLLALPLVACPSESGMEGSDSASASAEGTLSGTSAATEGSSSSTGGGVTGMTGNTSAEDSGAGSSGVTGPLFDVGSNGGSSTGSDTEYDGPGSCRQSEIYGAAGGYPSFDDPAYAGFTSTVLIMTSHDRLGPNDPQLRVIDISGAPPPPNMNYAAPMYIHPTWLAASFGGGIFGITLDSYGNIYVSASSLWSGNTTPGTIYKVDKDTALVSAFATVPNNGPAFGNLNYDCVSETIRVSSHEDCRIWQIDMNGDVVSTYHHGTGDVSIGAPNDPGEPNGQFCPLGDRVWAVQSHYGRIYYSVWWEDSGRPNGAQQNEIWSVAFDEQGIPDGDTRQLEATIPGLDGSSYSNPVSDLSFAATGWMLAAERTMYSDTGTSAHQSTTYELQQMNGTWQVVGETYVVGELPNSSAGGVDHDFAAEGYVWMTGDALDFYTPDVVYGVQGTPYGGGDITNSTLIDHDGDIANQYKTDLGDCEIPIPGDVMPPPPPPEG
ncbi:MAG: hypothetical protein K1X88_28585 [Nannocystaceae bacterium]|nr:hypothetical protein [Nannocystaceae bacterium]